MQKHFPLIVWHLKTKNEIICCQNDGLHFFSGINGQKKITKATIQSNLDYPDSWRLGWTVRIIESPDNWNIEMSIYVQLKLHDFILLLVDTYSVDKLAPFSNNYWKTIIIDCLPFGKNGSLIFCGPDEAVLMQKVACVLQTTLIELMVWNAFRYNVTCVSMKHLQICVLKGSKFSWHLTFII